MDILEKIDSMRDDIVKTAQEVVRIKSVQADPLSGMPFGQGVHDAYWKVMNLAKDMGFEILDVDGYAGHIDFGTEDKVVGILTHLDVVPEGDHWTYPPYGGEIHDGKIFGRGISDDKGPAIATLYAMKAIKECKIPLKKRLRLILGLNEESGWECMNYYMPRIKAPDIAFTPDAEFPAIHGEKGILQFELTKKIENKQVENGIKLYSINGGMCVNAVADGCEAVISYDKAVLDMLCEGITAEILGDRIKLSTVGVSAHGSTPEKGENAISKMYLFLNKLPLAEGDVKSFVKFYTEKIGFECHGVSMGCGLSDKESGKLSFNIGMTSMTESDIKVTVDVRYPITEALENVEKGIAEVIRPYGINYVQISHKASIYMPKDSELVKTLMAVYAEFTGDHKSEAITIGGGTYARAMDNCVAFGAGFPGEPEVAHQKDEYMTLDNLILITKIFAKALIELAQ